MTGMPLNPAKPAFCARLASELPPQVFREYDPAKYGVDLRGRYRAEPGVVVAPASAQEVSALLRLCNSNRVPVVPVGGGTGLVGGHVPLGLDRPVILSFERMNRIRAVHPEDNALIAEAGCILQSVHEAAEEFDRCFPLSLAAKGSSRIGGNLATNAGGVHVVRYGSMRDLCLGVEAVLPDGSIWDGLSLLRKDNAGYDLKNLLIGSEGTLAAITAASLKIFNRLNDEAAAFLAVADPAAAVKLLGLFKERFGHQVSAFEIVAGMGLRFLAQNCPEVRLPVSNFPDWSVLVDVGAESGCGISEQLEETAAEAFDHGWIVDGVFARSGMQRNEFWKAREMIPEANRRIGSIASHDVSVPISAIPEFVSRAEAAVSRIGAFRINCFGHVGDGNLHFNVFPPEGGSAARLTEEGEEVRFAVHALVRELGGSVAAEHGIGRSKAQEFSRFGDPVFLSALASLKEALDPNGIMNPGAVLPA